MDKNQQALNILAEIEAWTDGDRQALVESNGGNFGGGNVPFDGTFVFVARQKKINELKKLLMQK